jgi:hypothetical protein
LATTGRHAHTTQAEGPAAAPAAAGLAACLAPEADLETVAAVGEGTAGGEAVGGTEALDGAPAVPLGNSLQVRPVARARRPVLLNNPQRGRHRSVQVAVAAVVVVEAGAGAGAGIAAGVDAVVVAAKAPAVSSASPLKPSTFLPGGRLVSPVALAAMRSALPTSVKRKTSLRLARRACR